MIAAAIAWIIQDMFQVLAMGFMLVPELFLLVVVYKILAGSLDYRRISWWIWFAFVGGMLWDLRWAAAPGMSSIINVLAIMLVYWVWDRTPAGGRSGILFAALAGGVHFASGVAHYFAWAVPSQAAVRMFLIQQLMAVPLLIVLCMVYAFRSTDNHV